MLFFLSFLIGVVLFYSFHLFPFSTVFIASLATVFLFLKKKIFLIIILICGTALAFFKYEPAPDVPCIKDKIAVRGVFASYPMKTAQGSFLQKFSASSASDMNTGEKVAALTEQEIVLFSEREFSPGAECTLGVTLLKSRKRLNPGGLTKEETAANLSDIYYEGAKAGTLYWKMQEYRHRINNYLEENMKKDSGAFVASITTGQMTNMSEELREAFNVTGLAHILSISGSHFGLFSVFLFAIFSRSIKALPYRFLQRMTIYVTPSQGAAMLSLPFMLAYLGLSGASIPAIRSFIMISLFLCGLLIGKKGYWLNSLLFAAVILVAWEPESIFNLSFQLSFLAVLCIGFAVQKSDDENKEGNKFFRYLKNVLLMTFSASIGTAPIVANYFHYFSVISPLSNLILAPLIGFLLIPLSVVSSFLYLITGHFVFTSIVSLLSEISIASVKLLAGIPYASVRIPAFPPIVLILFYSGFIPYLWIMHGPGRMEDPLADHSSPPAADSASSIGPRPQGKNESPGVVLNGHNLPDIGSASRRCYVHKKWYILAIPFIPVVIYSLLLMCGKKDLSVTFLDVGQGDSAVIEFPDGKNMVIDTGKTGRETVSFLRYRGWKIVDILALSHVHPDHTGGLTSILKKFQVREIWDNGRIIYPDYLSLHSLKRGDVIEGKGYRIYALHPYPEFYTMDRGDYVSANNDSLVLKIEGNTLSFLFAGDIEEEAEENILHLGDWLKSTIIKVPHHGAKTSAWGPFFKTVSPDLAVISAGRDNSFGHPHQEMLDMLQGARVYRTDIDGAVKISESGNGLAIKTYREFQLKEAKSWSDEMKNFRLLFETW
jgi:competence protein ComEC